MPDFLGQAAFEIARRVELRGPNTWVIIVVHEQWNPEELIREVRLVVELPCRVISGFPFELESLLKALHVPADDVVIVTGLNNLTAEQWAALDLRRSALERHGALIMALPLAAVGRVSTEAPNLRSFVGGSIFVLTEDGSLMTSDQIELRLAELVESHGLTSEEVIKRASERHLPSDPDFAEWLILLGRGDLV
jgi:hypothetical protein